MTGAALFDVVVVGGGPVGALAANLLGQAGLSVRVIERDPAPYSLPRAVHVDHEMLRLFAAVGLGDMLLPMMRAGDGHIHFGADHGVIRFLSAAGQPRPFGYANDYFFYQPELETVLRKGLERFPKVRLDLGVVVEGLVQTDDSVTLSLSDGTEARARWVIGCDGARSTVRKALGVRLDDLDFEEPWLVVDAEVHGPIIFPPLTGVPEGANLQDLSCMMCVPSRPATIVPGRGAHRRWEFMLLPDEDDAAMAEPACVSEMIAPWVGATPHTIIRAATYRFHGLVAEHWHVGRVFLAGDAAHQTPPFFGQGLCHGLRDVAGLAWRLALVAQGRADKALFDSYQTERDAQVRHVIGAAVNAGRYICELDPQKAAARDRRIRSEQGMRTAAELIAPLTSDIIAPGAGERFINPRTGNGALLDDLAGTGWRLFANGTSPGPRARAFLAAVGARVIDVATLPDPDGLLAEWFAQRAAALVLVRPDFYVAALAPDSRGFDTCADKIAAAMALTLPDSTS
ncbi:bifunctional 3-(3-hydroxy-phenyl)propionate/3-hydroxycinnamic acid hydroxylase [Roseinatronobacter alkalisoli]|uniref:Bifunctional 3-(3-hydroxy-phenyl)propionate/3-hydroxycinnamic acid hydroxylase n=1 Tax=Roseinatronobacter alkalisoli TaxID=3028235 RepID=A0ABT5TCU8_9RHOB|nr:bifunctional 3-(3-hydroxy-phenyl)propionate/3-hydroxycinnamic acid hydroxylase [Roseinatronobacter sp. HJB301]MDD7972181.1 bifunctional 3-(3-hydroxy-phenyl)propionate/3-hydroxycinnamic acid hydroxylase [Roseinatronobacter sp. HJB301]